MNTASAQVLDRAIQRIDGFFDGVFASLEEWKPRLQQKLGAAIRFGALSGAQLSDLIEDDVRKILSGASRPLYGAGYCATEDIVSNGNPLAWWQGPDRALLASSTFGPGQAAIDLARLEWYRVPHSSGRKHVAGPFVDYLCSNEITVTTSVPLELDGAFSGVMCADILVSSLEEVLLPGLAELPGAVVVNSSGRVAISTLPDYETGDRLPNWDSEAGVRHDTSAHIATSKHHPFAIVMPQDQDPAP
ncbi:MULTISPECIES: hypothetical protein [unclassified Mycolicibacterium]|uniref:PDC sensor domain-containing protein n=1 Tax=unclassified Mycolicibacterium TaxID=2636767 RepID=UPI00130CB5DB|nr:MULTISPECIES: hypothetical protein [unclassified Mycolicibacterium]MUL81228.1 hypothetical protein [Mycolicibacterium sp. CBMA 329]MUL86994.1 hypothetical protein [Mycolicibacterium sp. CBMA 331]MUL98723.1 hypothetical protein [Mycolicibacterium sp. CBMA 334]MUM25586.1 hypothetical protein [Mycolicibacterium sp. CBMA 295]MUM37291.1 hypothetical protein [Mycolicibacterium sp. CBMA 247]